MVKKAEQSFLRILIMIAGNVVKLLLVRRKSKVEWEPGVISTLSKSRFNYI
jgi:hypothetical protein